jgi:hypothetical protein
MSDLQRWIGQLPQNPRQYKKGPVAYVTESEGTYLYNCLLFDKHNLHINNAKSHFNSPRHESMNNEVRMLENEEIQMKSESDSWKKYQNRVKVFDCLQKISNQIHYLPWKMEIILLCVKFLNNEQYCLSNVIRLTIKYIQLESIAILELAIWKKIGQPNYDDNSKGNNIINSTNKRRHSACTTGNSTMTIQQSMSKTGSQVIIPLVLQFLDFSTTIEKEKYVLLSFYCKEPFYQHLGCTEEIICKVVYGQISEESH